LISPFQRDFAPEEGNATTPGVNLFNAELEPKRLEFLRELISHASRIAVLINPSDMINTEATLRDLQAVATPRGLQLQFYKAQTPNEIDAIFPNLAREKPDAVFFWNFCIHERSSARDILFA
jgi:putative tryptophan/tyrosine transport system substrate-binding protein